MFFVCLCSCEVIPVHIFDKRDAVGLLVNSVRHCSYLGISEDKVWVEEVPWRRSLCGWPYTSCIFRRPCL
jgi:hypothetical protein